MTHICISKLSHLDSIDTKRSTELIAGFYHLYLWACWEQILLKLESKYASYLIALTFNLFEETAHVLTGGLWGAGLILWSCGSKDSGSHSGETDEANCSWLHPVWPPPKRPDQDNTFCVVSRASTELIFCIHRDFDARNNMCKPRRLVCECCRDISAWKSRVMKPTVLEDEANFWGALA